MGARARPVPHVVEHVGHAAAEGHHDDKEGDEEHAHVLHHHVDAQDDRAKVLRRNANLEGGL